jgi:hypothetical protein
MILRLLIILFLLIPAPCFAFGAAIQAVVSGGSAAACTPAFGNELAVTANATDDGGGSEADAITGWVDSNSALDSVTTSPSVGTYHLYGIADASNDGFTRQFSGLTANSTIYRHALDARHNGTGDVWGIFAGNASTDMDMYFHASDGVTSKSIASTSVTYKTYYKYMTYNTSMDYYNVRERGANTGGMYVDNASIKAVTTLCYSGSELHAAANAASLTNEANATTGWTAIASGLMTSVADPADGTYALKLDANSNDGAALSFDFNGILSNGTLYLITFKVKYISGDSFRCGFSAANTLATWEESWAMSSSYTSYTYHAFSFFYDAGGTHRYFGCKENGTSNNAVFEIDSVSVKAIAE